MTVKTRKKLIEVALPLEAINKASVREGYIYRGNPSAIHKWWAQRPLAAARAVIFAQMVDDPSEYPDLFPTEQAQDSERERLFRIIEDLVLWENTNNEEVLNKAGQEIRASWDRACADNTDHQQAEKLFSRECLPSFHDPFSGSGVLPLEAQRFGLAVQASDLNPVAVLISKATVDVPTRFAGRPPVNPDRDLHRRWRGAEGLADDVRYYGMWLRHEAATRIGSLYPKIAVTAEILEDRPDLRQYGGQELAVIAWLWARTVRSPNPAFAGIEVPLASTFMLSTKVGKEAWVEPVIESDTYRLAIRVGTPRDAEATKSGTKLGRGSNFQCLISQTPITSKYVKAEGQAGRLGTKLLAVVAETPRGRVYLPANLEHEVAARRAEPTWKPEGAVPSRLTGGTCVPYGLTSWGDLFTDRQLVALTTFSDLISKAMCKATRDAIAAGLPDDGKSLAADGTGATAYAEAVGMYLAFAQDKTAEYGCTLVPWYAKEDRPKGLFARQAIPMVWDFAEVNPLSDIGGAFSASVGIVAGALSGCAPKGLQAVVNQADAMNSAVSIPAIVSTDPPYYNNISYADLSDFFYVWLRRSLRSIFPDLFSTLAVPKAEELVAAPYRHGGAERAEAFFLAGMTKAMARLTQQSHPAFPLSIYYAFKQAENSNEAGVASTGWETFLEAVIRAGFSVTGTWPMRTERGARSVGLGTNALASSIVLVCRPLPAQAPTATRRDFVMALKAELPRALRRLQAGNIAPVDLAQAAIGSGMAVFTRFGHVLDAQGKQVSVREALAIINEILDEALAEQEGDFGADSRWALAWFEQNGFAEGDFGVAEVLSKAKVTSIAGLADAGIVESRRGKVRLLKPEELDAEWDPVSDPRLTAWEMVHHLVRALDAGGEAAAAELVAKLGRRAEVARELAYRLYVIAAERRKRAAEALPYNSLVQSWPEIVRLSREVATGSAQGGLFETAEV